MLGSWIVYLGSWITGYLVPWLSGFLVFGIVVQVIDLYLVKYEDRRWVPSYRWWYNRSRSPEDQMPQRTMGWFFNQTLVRKHNRAILISGVQSLIAVYFGSNAVLEFVAFLAEAWIFLPGLYLGVIAFRYLENIDRNMQRVDTFRESVSAFRMPAFVSGLIHFVRDKAKPVARATDATVRYEQPRQATTTNTAPSTSPAPTPQRGLSASEIIQRHKDGRKL